MEEKEKTTYDIEIEAKKKHDRSDEETIPIQPHHIEIFYDVKRKKFVGWFLYKDLEGNKKAVDLEEVN